MSNINYDKIKNEIQTSSGLLAEIKENELPDTKVMARLALKEYLESLSLSQEEIKEFISNNTSKFLKELLQCETRIYKAKTADLYRNFLKYYFKYHYEDPNSPYKEIKKLVDSTSVDKDSSKLEIMANTMSNLYPMIRHVVSSENQSKKSRVGHSLENHIINILQLLNIPYEAQIDTIGSVIDFVLPSKELLDKRPQNCLFLASQTTLKDRFRLSLSKIPKKYSDVRKYIVTASGLGIITNSDVNDLTIEKINSIRSQDTNLIVFKEVKEKKFSDYPNVISYEEFINEEIGIFLDHWHRVVGI